MENRQTMRTMSIMLVTSGPEDSFKERGPRLTASEGHAPSILLWSSSFDHLSYSVSSSPFGSQKWMNSEQSDHLLAGRDATNGCLKKSEKYLRLCDTHTHTHGTCKEGSLRELPVSWRQWGGFDGGVRNTWGRRWDTGSRVAWDSQKSLFLKL